MFIITRFSGIGLDYQSRFQSHFIMRFYKTRTVPIVLLRRNVPIALYIITLTFKNGKFTEYVVFLKKKKIVFFHLNNLINYPFTKDTFFTVHRAFTCTDLAILLF